jgi:thymidylate kinase
VVVSDRSLVSSLVYQAEGDLTVDDVWDLNMRKSDLPAPDLVVLVEVGLEEALQRVQARGATDSFETRERVARTIAGYATVAESVRWPFATVDGEGSVEEVHARILSLLASQLGLPR